MRREIALWVAAFVAVRAWALLVCVEDLYRLDERYAGAAAIELLAGNVELARSLAWDPYSGGSLVVVLLCAAGFTLFGPSLVVLKGIAVAFAAATAAGEAPWVGITSSMPT